MTNCCIKDCESPVFAKGMCSKHYTRVRKYGDPTKTHSTQIHGASLEERFNAYVAKGEGCWEWIGSKDANGYGRLNVKNIPVLAHRLSWKIYKGEITSADHVLHRCDNPACVRPEHLFLGDQITNNADKMAKKRHRFGVSRGEAHGCAVLTADQVREIRASVGVSRIIGEQFGISGRQVREIRARTAWRHIP